MNIRQLEAFRAVMIARSTIGAAELLALSQPAVSRLIAQLEASLHLTLFDRGTGRLVPTHEASLLYAEVERTFVSVDRIRELARDIRLGDAGSLTVGCLPLLAVGFVPNVMRAFNEMHPRTRVTLNVQMSPRIEAWAAAQQIDLGLAEYPADPGGFERSGIAVEEFCRVPYLLAVPAGHRLAGRMVAHPEDLAGERFVSLTRNTVGRLLIDTLFERAGVERDLVFDCQMATVVANLVGQGLGVGFVDPFTADDHAGSGLITLRFEPAIETRLGLLHPTHRPMSRVGSDFIALLRAHRREVLQRVCGPAA